MMLLSYVWCDSSITQPIHTFSFRSGVKCCISSCCSILAADFGAGWLLPDENCERCLWRRLQTERGVLPQDQGGLQAGPSLFGRLCLYEGQSRVLLHWQTGINRCLWGCNTFLAITIYERQWYWWYWWFSSQAVTLPFFTGSSTSPTSPIPTSGKYFYFADIRQLKLRESSWFNWVSGKCGSKG